MDFLTDWLTNWLKELLIGGIMGNLEGLFDTVNTQVGEIAAQVGTTPAAWHAGVFSLIRQLSETVILPIAGMVLTFVATYELIQMLLEKNNMHEVDVANLYKWMFKTACAILILSNTFNIVMAVFDVSQSVIAQAGGLIQGSTDVSADMLAELETSLEAMDLGPLLGLWLQSALIGFTMKAMGIIIFVLVYSCSTYKNRSRTACTMHSIKHERLEAAVLFAVQHQVHLAVSYSEIVTQINSAPIKKSQSYRLDDLIAAKERELIKITRYKQSLYQDWKDGEITQQEYRDMKADYERQTSDISAVLTRLNAERAELANGVDNEHPALVAFMKYQNIEALNREILVELVDYIKVYENGNISVKFKFADELRKIAEYIEINTTEDTAVAG